MTVRYYHISWNKDVRGNTWNIYKKVEGYDILQARTRPEDRKRKNSLWKDSGWTLENMYLDSSYNFVIKELTEEEAMLELL